MAKKNEETKNEQVEKEIADNKPVTPSVQMVPEVPEKETEPTPEPKEEKKTKAKTKKDVPIAERPLDQLVKEVQRGQHGSGRERMITLGSRYAEVQQAVNLEHRKASK